MEKFIGGVVLGVFVGALATEVLRRTSPNLIECVSKKTRAGADKVAGGIRNMRDAFMNGYREVTAAQH